MGPLRESRIDHWVDYQSYDIQGKPTRFAILYPEATDVFTDY